MSSLGILFLFFISPVCYSATFPRMAITEGGQNGENDEGATEGEIVSETASNLGNNEPECSFCVPYMLEPDCLCTDVDFCQSNNCEVPEACLAHCGQNGENGEEATEGEIGSAKTASNLGNNEPECSFCVPYMLEPDCLCTDVDFCQSNNCEVPEACLAHCTKQK